MKFAVSCCVFSLLFAGLALGSAASPAGAEEETEAAKIAACLERTLPSRSSVQTLELEISDDRGKINRSRAKVHWKRFEDELISTLIRFSEPPRRAGMAMLARQKRGDKPETFLYLPELRQTRRVSARNAAGSMFGTDFSYEDFAFLQGITEDSDPVVLPEREVAGRIAYVLESRVSIGDEPAYERILYFVEKERCIPLRAEFYEPGDTLRKVFEVKVDSIEAVGDRFVPMLSTMSDQKLGTQTAVTVVKIEPDKKIRDTFFEPSQLQVGAR